ncbi:hypothetical protein H9645_10805 [Luteimonas sp. Sa2BVA3]|uniref:Glycosyltransferase RgtA/B/C/D-like domain-containing protein n=1 Tax=Luteimonas colneyensis TaxID=2762230 RepID=A0ABR8ULQ5_9GAMM|nr:hypothetical protein [Luteimonas colneyensis]MBD7988514.1 hypothetical protein [Luteimonas colneyensis]
MGAAATWLLATVLLCAVLAAYKLLPGQLPHAQSMIGDAAYAQCLHDTRTAGGEGCLSFGYPQGAPKPFGLPVTLVAEALFAGDGRVTPGEVRTVYAGVVALAFLLATLLFRRVAGGWSLGVLGAGLYLLAPAVQLQSSFAALQLGLALVPGYLLFDILLLDALCARRHGRALGLLAVVAGLRVFAVFLDGYSFLFATVLSAVCLALAAVLAGRGARMPAIAALAAHVACTGLAAWTYRQYMPGGLGVMPVDFFRGAGVDVLTMLVPMQWQGLYGLLGLGIDIQPEMSYGGRASLLGMFVGYSSLVAAGLLAWAVATRRAPRPGLPACGIMLAGVLAVVLSLGPSLKFNDFRNDQTRVSALSFKAYLMPEEAATLTLHSGWIYENVPGIRNARVLGRWQVLARLALVAVMLLALAALWRGGHRWPAVALAAFALLEAVPDPRVVAEESRGATARADLVYRIHGGEFARSVRPGERVLMLQMHDGANDNEYAADTLCALARAYCYNAGGDKASGAVASAWPPVIRAARARRDRGANVREAFSQDLLDVVVVPHFDLRLVVYPWSTERVDVAAVSRAVQTTFGGPDLHIEEGPGFTIIRPRAPRPPVVSHRRGRRRASRGR